MTNKTAKMFVALSLAALQATTPAFASLTTSSTPPTNTNFNDSTALPAPTPYTAWVDRLLNKLANFFYPKQAILKSGSSNIITRNCTGSSNFCKFYNPKSDCLCECTLDTVSGELFVYGNNGTIIIEFGPQFSTDEMAMIKILTFKDDITGIWGGIVSLPNLEVINFSDTLERIYIKFANNYVMKNFTYPMAEQTNDLALENFYELEKIIVGQAIPCTCYPNRCTNCPKLELYDVDTTNSVYKFKNDFLYEPKGIVVGFAAPKINVAVVPNDIQDLANNLFYNTDIKKAVLPATVSVSCSGLRNCNRLRNIKYLSSKKPSINLTNSPFPESPFFENSTAIINVPINYNGDTFCNYPIVRKTIVDAGYLPNGITAWVYENNAELNVDQTLTIAGFEPLTVDERPWEAYCDKIKSIIIEDGIPSIDGTIFQNCTALETVSLPATVTKIAEGTFSSCPNLKTITVDPENPNFCDKDGVLFSKDGTMLMFYPCGNTSPTYDVPAGTQSFALGSFDNNQSLTEIKLPASLVALAGAIGKLKNLQNVIVDPENPSFCEKNGVLFNKSGTYLYSYPLGRTSQAYTIPEGTKTIGVDAFGDNQSLEEITIPASVETVIDYPFCELPKLSTINYLGSKDPGFTIDCNPNLQVNVYKDYNGDECMGHMVSRVFDKGNYNGIDWNFGPYGELTLSGSGEICAICPWEQYKNAIKKVTVKNGVEAIDSAAFYGYNFEKIELPESLKTIGRSAFESCEQLQAIVIPKGVEKIGESAFKNCKNLENITINTNIREIDEKTFYGCSKLSSFEIPTTVETIHSRAFKGCSNLHKIDIGGNVNVIGENVFTDCQSLESINVADTNKAYSSIDGVLFTKNGTTLLRYPANKKETSYEIPKTVETVGEFAFHKCNNLENVTMPDGCAISLNAFYNCESLKNVNLGSNITKIDDHAFAFCTNLKTVEYYGESDIDPKNLGTDIFYGCDQLKATTNSGLKIPRNYTERTFAGLKIGICSYAEVEEFKTCKVS